MIFFVGKKKNTKDQKDIQQKLQQGGKLMDSFQLFFFIFSILKINTLCSQKTKEGIFWGEGTILLLDYGGG